MKSVSLHFSIWKKWKVWNFWIHQLGTFCSALFISLKLGATVQWSWKYIYCSIYFQSSMFSVHNIPFFFPNGKYILFLGYTSIHVFSTILQHAGYVHSCLKFSFLGFRRLHMIMKEIPIHFSLCSLSKFKCRFLD